MNSRNGSGGAQPGRTGFATGGRAGDAAELEDALDRVRELGRTVSLDTSHEERAADLKELIIEARRALVVSASLASAFDAESGVLHKRTSRRSMPMASSAAPSEWLVRSVVHDLNNMLLVIQNCAESLKQQAASSVGRDLHVVEDAVSQATRLVAKLVPTDPGIGRPAGLDLADCVERFSGVIGSLVGDRIEVVTRLGSDLPPVRCEETGIFRVLSNLAANARDAMPKGGTLTLEASRVASFPGSDSTIVGVAAGYVLLTMTDTGEGMDAVTSDKAFDPFFTTKAPGEGTGVGLTAVREIVESTGGVVQIESKPGGGTTVSVFFACSVPPA
ncbi:MAG TPA: sensor histidine kinase [Polyangiaceae bacterium]|nr:sensor histidine kinase [Polyangiaceae bacterium]